MGDHKYHVVKSDRVLTAGDPESGIRVFNMDDEIAHDEFTVLLRPAAGDYAAREALRVYADLIEDAYPQFAADIRENMDRLDSEDPPHSFADSVDSDRSRPSAFEHDEPGFEAPEPIEYDENFREPDSGDGEPSPTPPNEPKAE